jgi:hypothetical protein
LVVNGKLLQIFCTHGPDQSSPEKVKTRSFKMLSVTEVPEQSRADFVPATLWH